MKKTLIAIVVIVLACFCVVGTTLAWLVDKTPTITNTFTFGNVDIDLTESPNLDLKMIPGKTITKDPKVTVAAGSEACWVFVKIEASANYNQFFADYAVADGWTELEDNIYYRSVVSSNSAQEFPVLAGNQITVLKTVTKAHFEALTDATAPTLAFTAYAVQKDGVATAAEAWEIANS